MPLPRSTFGAALLTLGLAGPGLTGCSDPIVVDGKMAGKSLDNPLTAFWGGPFLIFSTKDLDCMDVSFVRRIYTPGESPTDFDFVGLQFTWQEDAVTDGVYSVEGEAAVYAKGLVVEGGAFTDYRGRTGNIVVEKFEVGDDFIEGSFDVQFGDDGGLSSSWFEAQHCVNLTR